MDERPLKITSICVELFPPLGEIISLYIGYMMKCTINTVKCKSRIIAVSEVDTLFEELVGRTIVYEINL